MVIQRIQSLLLLIAAALMAIDLACFHVCDNLTLLVLGCVAGALMLIDIFLFKDLKKQMLVANVAAFITVAFIAIGAFIYENPQEPSATGWVWPAIIAVISVLLTLWAKARMKADYNLLRSADRLR